MGAEKLNSNESNVPGLNAMTTIVLKYLPNTDKIGSDKVEELKIAEIAKTIEEKLGEIAFFQSHQVRGPIATILGLYSLFRFDDPSHPVNAEILSRLKISIESLDNLSHQIVTKTVEIRKLK